MELLFNPATTDFAGMSMPQVLRLFPQALDPYAKVEFEMYQSPVPPRLPSHEPDFSYSPEYHSKTHFNPENGQFAYVREMLSDMQHFMQVQSNSGQAIWQLYQTNPFNLPAEKRFGFAFSRFLFDCSIDYMLKRPLHLPGYFEMMRRSGANGMMTLADTGTSYFRSDLENESGEVDEQSFLAGVENILAHQTRRSRYLAPTTVNGIRVYEEHCLGRPLAVNALKLSAQAASQAGKEITASVYETFNEYSQVHIELLLAMTMNHLLSYTDYNSASAEFQAERIKSYLGIQGRTAAVLLSDQATLKSFVETRRSTAGISVPGQLHCEMVYLSSLERFAT